MNYRQLEAFKTFIIQGTVTKAAEKLQVSQSSVSRLLISLENEVDFRMFDRKRNQLVATKEGRVFYKTVIRSFIGMKEIESQAKAIADKQVGTINIVAQPLYFNTYLLDVIAKFKQQHPNVGITLHEEGVEGILEKVSNRSSDFGIGVTLNMETFGINVTQLSRCRAACLLPINHHLKDEEVLTLEKLSGEKFVELHLGSPLRVRVDNLFYSSGIHRNIVAQTETLSTVCGLVERGVGLAIIDPFVSLLMDDKKSIIKPLEVAIEWDVAIFSPSDHRLNEIEQAFIELLKEHLLTLN